MLGRTDSQRRILVVLVALCVAAGALSLRLAQWQIVERDRLASVAERQTTLRQTVPAQRGSIYDRSGTILLATTVERYRVAATPDQLTRARRTEVGQALARILGVAPEATPAFVEQVRKDVPYVVLARDVDESMADRIRSAIRNGRLEQVALEPEPFRIYPQPGGDPSTTLAAHVIGFVNREGIGQYGVEERYQDVLAGRPKLIVAQRDANNRAVPDTAEIVEPGNAGADLRLTIDAGLQLAVEQELLATYLADAALSVTAVVMDPTTGEIYAEASAPSYDANAYREVAATDAARFLDPAISKVYEPGSVLKMLTAVAALERDTVTLKTKIHDTGTLKLDGGKTKVSDADGRDLGFLTFEDIVAYSRNVGVARVALGLGPTLGDSSAALYETWREFGFGRPTGVDLAGEVGGLVRDPAQTPWAEIDLANGSFGQGVAVTPMQLAAAFAAMVNGGRLVRPHVVAGVGESEEAPGAQAEGLVTEALSHQLTGLMNHVVTEVPFYRDRTLVPGYVVGGKTGTAQIWDAAANGGRGGWKHNKFNYSFVGYIGRQVPEVVVAVRIEEARPSSIRRGLIELPVMSFELFRRVATNAMTILDLAEPAAPSPTPDKGDGWSDPSPTPVPSPLFP
jgi:cell division protein FtsI (penicillin-binding protein 3)